MSSQISKQQKEKIIRLLENNDELPEGYRELLFPNQKKEYELVYAGKERKEDIIPIMEYYINKFSGFKKPYSDEALAVYMNHDWKEGNIRELRDAVKYMCVRSNGSKTIELSHINSDYYLLRFLCYT